MTRFGAKLLGWHVQISAGDTGEDNSRQVESRSGGGQKKAATGSEVVEEIVRHDDAVKVSSRLKSN